MPDTLGSSPPYRRVLPSIDLLEVGSAPLGQLQCSLSLLVQLQLQPLQLPPGLVALGSCKLLPSGPCLFLETLVFRPLLVV